MRKLILLIFITIASLAHAEVNQNDVVMVSYEQRWIDHEGTIALKNNTSGDVNKVTFMITYLDMNGTQLDYSEYTIRTNIKPGMSKKANIPAYEHNRHYSYYKSEGAPGSRKPFKIRYTLISHDGARGAAQPATKTPVTGNKEAARVVSQGSNVKHSGLTEKQIRDIIREEVAKALEGQQKYATNDIYEDNANTTAETAMDEEEPADVSWWFPIISLITLLFAFAFIIGLYYLVGKMAIDRGRSSAGWIALSLFLSPIIVIILLALFGDANDRRERY